ncbi:MAG: hypothetical protein LPK26_21090 [Bacillaceae bacterium]|nr:hypothetical protein [Bacillaceae bacterium]
MALRLIVGCTKFPNITGGQIGFASRKEDPRCLEPNYRYENGNATGFVHTRDHDELFSLCKQIGAMSKNEFIVHHQISQNDSWKNDYIRYLDKEIERALLDPGIKLTIEDNQIEFYTEPGYYTFTIIKPSKRFMELYGEV